MLAQGWSRRHPSKARTKTSDVGERYPREACGRPTLLWRHRLSITIWASRRVWLASSHGSVGLWRAMPQQTIRLAMIATTRRTGLHAMAAAWLAAVVGLNAPMTKAALPDDPAATSSFVQQAGSELAAIMSAAASNEDKLQRLRAFIDRVADVDAVARFCLGRFWPQATPPQQGEFTRLFHDVLINSISGQSHDYEHKTTTVTVAQAEPRADGMHVATTVTIDAEAPFRVIWVVSYGTGSPKIIDVIAEGISMRVTQRSDYVSFLTRNRGDIDALIKAVRQQLREVPAPR
jgi:phospholipid transport system substrate-binding protein